jgi:hypothetical protein
MSQTAPKLSCHRRESWRLWCCLALTVNNDESSVRSSSLCNGIDDEGFSAPNALQIRHFISIRRVVYGCGDTGQPPLTVVASGSALNDEIDWHEPNLSAGGSLDCPCLPADSPRRPNRERLEQ